MKIILSGILCLVLILTGCAPQAEPIILTATSQPDPTQAIVLPSDTPQPSPTPEAGKVILVAPPGSDFQAIQAVLVEMSGQAGLNLEVIQDLPPDGLTPNTRVVVMTAPTGNLNELLLAAPQAQFVVISDTDLQAAGNLSVIRRRLEYQAFVAGFISVLLSTDWRSAGLLPSDGPLGASLQDAFINGGRYFCGMCGSGWPLGVYYPQVTQLAAASDGPSWQSAAAEQFDTMKVEVYFLAAEAAKPEVYAYLQGRDQFGKIVLLVGVQPPPDELRDQWAATVSFDTPAALRQIWPDLLAGSGGSVIETDMKLLDVNSDNLSEGRLRLVNQLLDEIRAGKVYPFTVPQQ